MKYSIKLIIFTLTVSALYGCATAPAPKPVITQPTENVEEQKRLETASKPFAQGLKALDSKDYKKARDILISLARQYPEYAGIYANLGIAHMYLDEDKEAQAAFDTALQKKPDLVAVYNQLGLLHRRAGRFQASEKAYQDGIALDPQFSQLYLNLGILYDLYMMDLEKALENYKKYKELAQPAEDDPVHKWIIDLTNRTNPVQ